MSIPKDHQCRKMNPLVLPEEYKSYTKEQWLSLMTEKSEEEPPPSPTLFARSTYHADVLRRRKIFIEKFSFDDIPIDGNIILTTKEAYSCNDFQVNVRYEFIKYVNGISDIIHRGDKRGWAKNTLEELHLIHNRWDYLPIVTLWCMMGKTKHHYVMWLAGYQSSYRTTRILLDVIKYGSFDLFLALMGTVLSNHKSKKNLIDDYNEFLEVAVSFHNSAVFRVLETLNLNGEQDNRFSKSVYLERCCVTSTDTGDELTEYLVSGLSNGVLTPFDNLVCFKFLTDNKQWRRVKFLQDTLNKHNLLIDSKTIITYISSLCEEDGLKVEEILRN